MQARTEPGWLSSVPMDLALWTNVIDAALVLVNRAAALETLVRVRFLIPLPPSLC